MNLQELNREQRKAAETLEGPVLILAGAGSGKTRALTYRIANLIDHGVAPWNILAITFTNKAAKEMRERVSKLVGDSGNDVWVSTFHAMCARILRRDIEKLGYSRSFTIYDDDDQASVLKEIYKAFNIDEKNLNPRELKSKISDAKNRLLGPDEWFAESGRDFRSQQIHDIYSAYERKLKASNALDFDDLLVRTLELFADHPPVLESYREKFRYVHVDEYQDTNFAQYSLVKLITQKSRNICVVGDDDQSIYGWRGADIRNILDFEKDYPDATVIKLEQNYRSTANILDAANQVIAHNEGRMEKMLWTEAAEGDPIRVFCAGSERDEAAWICDRMQQLKTSSGFGFGDMSILYRSNAQSRVLEDMLVRAGIPYRIYGGLRFYDRKEVKDIVAYLRVIVNPSDDASLRRIINTPKRAIGDTTVAELAKHAAQEEMPLFSALVDIPETLGTRPRKSVGEFGDLMNELIVEHEDMGLLDFVTHLIEKTGLKAQYTRDESDEGKARVENIDEFLGAVAEYEKAAENPSLEDYLENVALISDLDNADIGNKSVTLMTIHSAKGLEFPIVFMTGLEETIFPTGRSLQNDDGIEEERRLCYVAITRAQKQLYISYASQRMLYNQVHFNAPSRFLKEIPPRLLDNHLSPKRERTFPNTLDSYSHQTPKRSAPRYAPTGAGQGNGKSALGIPGVQKGFTPSAVSGIAGRSAPSLFKPGDRVMHRKFGEGTVQEIRGSGMDARIIIGFAAYGQKEFALSIAPIVKVND